MRQNNRAKTAHHIRDESDVAVQAKSPNDSHLAVLYAATVLLLLPDAVRGCGHRTVRRSGGAFLKHTLNLANIKSSKIEK